MTVLLWSLYQDRSKNFRVKATSRNGNRLWASSEGYQRKGAAVRNAVIFGAPKCLAKVPLGSLVRTTR